MCEECELMQIFIIFFPLGDFERKREHWLLQNDSNKGLVRKDPGKTELEVTRILCGVTLE